jgi:signal transduction histidine kinase
MVDNSNTKKIITYIVLFPPIALLIYAIVSYIVFFNYQDNINKEILKVEKETISRLTKSDLASKVESINRAFGDADKKSLLNFLNRVVTIDCKHIVVLDKNRNVIFNSSNKNIDFIKNIKGKNGFYEDDNIFAYYSANNKKNRMIISFFTKHHYNETVNELKSSIENYTKTTVFKSIIWLFVIWFILVSVSLYSSIMVYKKMKEYEKKIEESNENIIFQSRQAMLGELLPMIAHQWRQPINKIAAVLMKMRFEISKGVPDITTLDRQCQEIEDSVELMSNTIDDFRSFYRPKEEATYEDLAIVIRKAIYFLDDLLEEKHIKINQNLSHVKAKIHTNEFLQVIINLIKNAADAVGLNGEIDILLKETPDFIEIRIEDNGTGIPQDKLEKIFEPHVSTKQNSMGLGLYMSKMIIENRFGGIIRAYNTAKGAGFLIRLPKS